MGETPVNTVIPVNLVSNGTGWKVQFPNGGSFTVKGGDSDTINWVLEPTPSEAIPSGAAISAVTFSKSTPSGIPWVGEISVNTENIWTTNDTNDLPEGENQEQWAYTVAVLYERVQYQSDPEITNTPPTPTPPMPTS